jgi:hypothetical protein
MEPFRREGKHGEKIQHYFFGVEAGEPRLEWSYLLGRTDLLLRRTLMEAVSGRCWVEGAVAEIRHLLGTGGESLYGVSRLF